MEFMLHAGAAGTGARPALVTMLGALLLAAPVGCRCTAEDNTQTRAPAHGPAAEKSGAAPVPGEVCAGHVSSADLPRAARYRIDVGQPVNAVAISPDGLWFATGDERGDVCLRAADTGASVRRLGAGAHQGPVTAVGFTADGKVLVSVGGDGVLRLWDAAPTGFSTGPVHEISQAEQGGGATAGAAPGTGPGRVEQRSGKLPAGHQPASILAMDTAPVGPLVVTGAWDGRVRLWNARTGAHVRDVAALPVAVRDVAFSPNGEHIAVIGQGMVEARIYDVATGELITRATGAVQPLVAIAFAANGDLVAIDGMAGSAVMTFARGNDKSGAYQPARPGKLGFAHPGRALALGPEGATVLIGADDDSGRVLAGDRRAGTAFVELRGHSNAVAAVAVAPHGQSALSAGLDGRIFAWDLGAARHLGGAGEGRRSGPETGSAGAPARQRRGHDAMVAAYRTLQSTGCDPARSGVSTPMEARILAQVPRALAGESFAAPELAALFAGGGWPGPAAAGAVIAPADRACMERLAAHEEVLRSRAALDPRVERVLTSSLEVFTGLRQIAQPDLQLGKGRQRAADDQVYWIAPCNAGCRHVAIMCEIDISSGAPSCEVDKR